MRVEFQTDGGFAGIPGLSKPVVIDSATLSEQQATQLNQLVARTDFFTLPTSRSPALGAADYQRYTITVEDGQRRHTIHLFDPIDNPDLQELVGFLQTQAKAQRAAARKRATNT